jgi:hypothetical protein
MKTQSMKKKMADSALSFCKRHRAVGAAGLSLLLGFGVGACGGEQAKQSTAFAADWTVVCTDESNDVREMATIGQKLGNPDLLASADLLRAVVKAQDVDSNGVVQSLELGIKVRNPGNFPSEIERAGGSSQGYFAKVSVWMTFRPVAGYEEQVTLAIDLDARGEYGKVSLFNDGNYATFPVSYDEGVFAGVIPVEGLSISDADELSIGSFASWTMPDGFVFSAMDESSSCVRQVE